MEPVDYEPEAAASRHTRSRNALVFASEEQLIPEHRGHPARYRFCLKYLSPDDRVLDCACGCGYGSAILAQECASVVGVDLHDDLIEFAQDHWARPNIEYRQFDVSAGPLPFSDGAFTAVVSLETLEHVPDAGLLLKEFRRVLRPDGLLLVSTPQWPLGNPHHVREFVLGELCGELEEAGFPVTATFVQAPIDDFRPAGAPVAGEHNFVVAGRRPRANPLARVVDEQYTAFHATCQQLAEARRELEEERGRLDQA